MLLVKTLGVYALTRGNFAQYVFVVIFHYNVLTAHNWQKWKEKNILPACHYHRIYRVGAVDLKIPIILKNYDFLCEYMKKFRAIFLKNLYFFNYYFNKVQNLKIRLHICYSYNCEYPLFSKIHFYLVYSV